MTTTVGVLRLGAMGRPIAGHLVDGGLQVVVFDLDREAVEAVASSGARAAGSPAELAAASDVMLVLVASDDQVLRDVPESPGVHGPGVILPGLRVGAEEIAGIGVGRREDLIVKPAVVLESRGERAQQFAFVRVLEVDQDRLQRLDVGPDGLPGSRCLPNERRGRLIQFVDRAGIRARKLHRVRDDRGQHFLEVERGGDCLPDLPEGLQLADTIPQLPKQSRVLDGDDSLIGA